MIGTIVQHKSGAARRGKVAPSANRILSLLMVFLGSAQTQTARAQVVPVVPDPCLASAGPSQSIAAIDPRGDILLSDGRKARLMHLDLTLDAQDGAMRAAHHASLKAIMVGEAVHFDVAPMPDRWGRLVLRTAGPVMDAGDARDAVSLHEALVERGLARLTPDDGSSDCYKRLLAIETSAIGAKIGLWRGPSTRLLSATETDHIKAQEGRAVVVEGVIVSVGQRPAWTYLNFGRASTGSFSATIPRRALSRLEAAGLSPSLLHSKRVRVRGIVSGRAAPTIEITRIEQIDILMR